MNPSDTFIPFDPQEDARTKAFMAFTMPIAEALREQCGAIGFVYNMAQDQSFTGFAYYGTLDDLPCRVEFDHEPTQTDIDRVNMILDTFR